MSDKLLAWQTMPELSRPRYVEQIQRFKRNGNRPQMETLETLISRNIGFKLFKELERVKKQLSSEHSALLQFEFEFLEFVFIEKFCFFSISSFTLSEKRWALKLI